MSLHPLVIPSTVLAVIAVLDFTLAGFRAGAGRHGLVRHLPRDRRDAAIGLAVGAVLIMPFAGAVAADAVRAQVWSDAGWRMIAVFTPYALITLVALAVVVSLGWRRRFLATAIVLGPTTLIRPLVAIAGGLAAAVPTGSPVVLLGAAWAVSAALLVEPITGRVVRRISPPPGRPASAAERIRTS